jgi:hypothetical protein
MAVDGTDGSTDPAPPTSKNPLVLKIIKKVEVICLCSQHNPVRFNTDDTRSLFIYTCPRPLQQPRKLANKIE